MSEIKSPVCQCGATMVQCHDDVPQRGITLAIPNGRYFCFSCDRANSELLAACKLILSECQTYNSGGSGEFTAAPSLGALERVRQAVTKARPE